MIYPPRAYPFMPYLAPFLLKGYLRSESRHLATVHDLNIEYHRLLWSDAFGTAAARLLFRAGKAADALLAELLAARGDAAVAALRTPSTYAQIEAVRFHSLLLGEAARLDRLTDQIRGVPGDLPDAPGAWQPFLDRWLPAWVSGFLHHQVRSGRFDAAGAAGISIAYVEQLAPALLLARFLKQRRPACRVVLGGNGITHFLDEVLTDHSLWTHVDAVVPFEGEVSLLDLLDRWEAGQPMPGANVAHRDGGRIRYEQAFHLRPRVQAEPDFSDLRHLYPTPAPIYPLLTAKGCYWGKCAFCTHHEGYGQGYQPFVDDFVSGALTRLHAAGARHFYFVDEALPPRTVTRLADLFQHLSGAGSGPAPRWTAEARMEKPLASAAAADLLKRSGCHLLVNGIESGCQETIDRMAKGIDLARVGSFARECARAGIRTGWMCFIGFPGETEAQARMTFAFIRRHMDLIEYASVGTFKLQRRSPVWADPGRFGVAAIIDPEKPYVRFDLASRRIEALRHA